MGTTAKQPVRLSKHAQRAMAVNRPKRNGSPIYQKRDQEPPEVEPLFGVLPYWPGSPCAHFGPIATGSSMYCPQCHQSGKDAALQSALVADFHSTDTTKADAAAITMHFAIRLQELFAIGDAEAN
jgi:hypothetical protein